MLFTKRRQETDVVKHVEGGELVEVMRDYRAEPMPMTLLYSHRHHLSRRLQALANWLEDLLGKATWLTRD